MKAEMLKLTNAASRCGEMVPLVPTSHCGLVWSSDPNILQEDRGGWTRRGRCGKCDADLLPKGGENEHP